jgi:type 2A phosphatase activator TIP41
VISGDIKIRVMPACWYVLYRVFVRVDGLVVKLRDTRLFHKFQTNEIHVDITLKELPINNDSIPSNMLRDPALINDRMTIVNEKEGIGRYYKLILDA